MSQARLTRSSKTFPGDRYCLAPRAVIFAEKFCPGKGLLTTLKNFFGVLLEGCWCLELIDALIGNKIVNCLYSFHGYDAYDVIFLNCVQERSRQCENWNDVIPVR